MRSVSRDEESGLVFEDLKTRSFVQDDKAPGILINAKVDSLTLPEMSLR